MPPLMLLTWAFDCSTELKHQVMNILNPLIDLTPLSYEKLVRNHFSVMSTVFAAASRNEFLRNDVVNWKQAGITQRFNRYWKMGELSQYWVKAKFDWTLPTIVFHKKVNARSDGVISLTDVTVTADSTAQRVRKGKLYMEARMSFDPSTTKVNIQRDVFNKAAGILKDTSHDLLLVALYRSAPENPKQTVMPDNVIVLDVVHMKQLLGPTMANTFECFCALSIVDFIDDQSEDSS